MVFNETTNYDFILLSKQGRTQLIYSTELTTSDGFTHRRNRPWPRAPRNSFLWRLIVLYRKT